MLEGWPKSVSAAKINQLIQKDLENRRNRSKELSNDKESDPIEEGKKEDAMRRLMNKYRPPHYWNFFEEEIEVVPHVFRPEADPNKCYIDGRVAVIL